MYFFKVELCSRFCLDMPLMDDIQNCAVHRNIFETAITQSDFTCLCKSGKLRDVRTGFCSDFRNLRISDCAWTNTQIFGYRVL